MAKKQSPATEVIKDGEWIVMRQSDAAYRVHVILSRLAGLLMAVTLCPLGYGFFMMGVGDRWFIAAAGGFAAAIIGMLYLVWVFKYWNKIPRVEFVRVNLSKGILEGRNYGGSRWYSSLRLDEVAEFVGVQQQSTIDTTQSYYLVGSTQNGEAVLLDDSGGSQGLDELLTILGELCQKPISRRTLKPGQDLTGANIAAAPREGANEN